MLSSTFSVKQYAWHQNHMFRIYPDVGFFKLKVACFWPALFRPWTLQDPAKAGLIPAEA